MLIAAVFSGRCGHIRIKRAHRSVVTHRATSPAAGKLPHGHPHTHHPLIRGCPVPANVLIVCVERSGATRATGRYDADTAEYCEDIKVSPAAERRRSRH